MQSVIRLRAKKTSDDWSQEVEDWSDPVSTTFTDAFVEEYNGGSSSDKQLQGERDLNTHQATLTIFHQNADIKFNDRVKAGDKTYIVASHPSSDVNPFTGWSPTTQCKLEVWHG